MNQFLYLDNFRGFADTYISIEDVNFLVGENSTGKTSVLGLLQTISSDSFFEKSEFRGSRINFGSFSDIVSAHAEDRDYFRVGLGWENIRVVNNEEKGPTPMGLLATYVKSDGHDVMPQLRELTLSDGDASTSLLLQTAHNGGQNGGVVSLRYKIHRSQAVDSLATLKQSIFPQWVRAHANKSDENAYELAFQRVPSKSPTLMFQMMAMHDYYKKQSERQDDESKEDIQESLPGIYTMALPKEPLVWIAPIRTKPRRIYDNLAPDYSPGGEHTPYVLKRMLDPRAKKTATTAFKKALREIGASSGLFEAVKIKSHGEEATAPFEVDVVLDGEALNLCTVGYGVSQSLPVLVEVLTRTSASWFAIQQPEVHLHPRAQAVLGDTLFQTAVQGGKRFLVETHSDFMIDRFRMNFQRSNKKKPVSQILFFERKNRKNVITPISIDENGELPADQPDTYRKFFLEEEMRLLRIK